MNWIWIGFLVFGAIALSALLGGWIFSRVLHRWVAWRSVLREDREDRRRRKCRVAVFEAMQLLDSPNQYLALHTARRAWRQKPRDPQALYVLGLAWEARPRYELALKHLEEAYRIMEVHGPLEYLAREEEDNVASLAMEASRLCARLRRDARGRIERELWAERVLEWAAIAIEKDPVMAMGLSDDPLLRELRVQVRLMPMNKET